MNDASPYDLGVVIGKFLPPHAGHHHLIDTAASHCLKLVVFVCVKPTDPVPGDLRLAWLREAHPGADVRFVDDCYDENDSRVWAENTLHWLGRAPDAVFTSEDYGEVYAAHMGCIHQMVDRARVRIPCSGTLVRADPLAQWHFLSRPVRAWFAKRIIVVGAESTGTTTLSMALAAHFGTVWVPEYGRAYSAKKMAENDSVWRTEEFRHIAAEQNRLEDQAALDANKMLIGDTNAFATALWHRRYMGFEDPGVGELAAQSRADLYFLTGDEIPFVQDGLRDGEHIRHDMHRWFDDALTRQSKPWVLLRGSPEKRLADAVEVIRGLWGL